MKELTCSPLGTQSNVSATPLYLPGKISRDKNLKDVWQVAGQQLYY